MIFNSQDKILHILIRYFTQVYYLYLIPTHPQPVTKEYRFNSGSGQYVNRS